MMEYKEPTSFFERMCYAFARHRVWVLCIVLAITMVFLYGAFHIKGEVVLAELFPYDHPYLKLNARFAKVFGGGGTRAVIALKTTKGDVFNERTLTKIQNMTRQVELWEEVYRSLTVSMASNAVKVVNTRGPGEIAMEPLMFPDIPKDAQQMETLKRNIFSNPAYNGSFVSEDGTACLLMTEFKENVSYQRAFALLTNLRKEFTDSETSVHIVGFPMLMGWIYSLKPQTYGVFAISIIAIALILFLIYRNLQGMTGPLANAGILTIWGLGFIGFTGVNFSPLLYVLAFLVGARMIGNSNQITYRYFEELNASGGDRIAAAYQTMRTMWLPNCAAVATDAAGFLVLLIAKIVLMQHLAVIMSFWMMSIILTGLLVPIVCSLIPLKVASEKWAKESCRVDKLARIMMKITHFSIAPRTKYVIGVAIIVLAIVCFFQTTRLKIGDPTPGSPIFYQSHIYNQDQALINRTFDASSENLTLYFEGERESVYDPGVFATFLDFDKHMQRTLPDIYKSSNSLINLIEMVNETFHEGDKLWYDLPRDPEMVTVMIAAARRSAGRGTLNLYMDEFNKQSRINLFFADHTSDNLLRIRDAAYGFFKHNPVKTERGQFMLAGGSIGLELGLNDEMKRTHGTIDLMVLCAIFILCTLSYRSIVAGLMLTLPLILANSVAAAYMAWKGIGLSINTLPVAAIGVGVGVDFAIYLYSRCQEEFPLQNGDWTGTIIQAICTCGKAVVYTGLTIILPIISWYFFSDMKFQAEVGFFLSMIMGTNVILTLTLHPLMIAIIKPKFISKAQS
jgi:uncharacterized protein